MKEQAYASAKSKEVQRHLKANAQLHHICFCPTLQENLIYTFEHSSSFHQWKDNNRVTINNF